MHIDCLCWQWLEPTLEYGSEVWEANKTQAAALESLLLGGAKCILGCLSRTCNEAVRGDMGLGSLQGHRDKAKLKWWYKLAVMEDDRYPHKLSRQNWNIKPHRGHHRKSWSSFHHYVLIRQSAGRRYSEWGNVL